MEENYPVIRSMESENSVDLDHVRWQQARDAAWQDMHTRKASFFGKWMWILFLMIIPDTICAIIKFELITEIIPWMNTLGTWLDLICTIVSGLILIKMSEKESQYQIAGVFMIVTNIINTAIDTFEVSENWSFFILLPTMVLGLIATYTEYMAHASVMSGIDDAMAKKWRELWTWYVRILLCLAGSIVLMLIIPLLGLVVFSSTAIGFVVVLIVELVYLYRSAKICRGYLVVQ